MNREPNASLKASITIYSFQSTQIWSNSEKKIEMFQAEILTFDS